MKLEPIIRRLTVYKPVERYLVDTKKIDIPDAGLGEFRFGLTEENIRFNPRFFLLNLIPVIGQVAFIKELFYYWWVKALCKRILIYKNGFILQEINSRGRIRAEHAIDFREEKNVLYYKSIYYKDGKCLESYVDINFGIRYNELRGYYYNQKKADGRIDFIGHVYNSLRDAWIPFTVQRFHEEIQTTGYATFKTGTGVNQQIQIGRDFIKIKDVIINTPFFYSYGNEKRFIFIYPSLNDDSRPHKTTDPIILYIGSMCNRDAFLLAFNQMHGTIPIPSIKTSPQNIPAFSAEFQLVQSPISQLNETELSDWMKQHCSSLEIDENTRAIKDKYKKSLGDKYGKNYVDWIEFVQFRHCIFSALKWILILGTVIFLAHLPIILD